jgi:hypothetical protein
VGRSEANDLVIRDPALSRFHAEIRKEGEAWVVADRGSRNGIRLNGQLVRGRSPVGAGDKITLGQTVLLFDAGGSDAAPQGGDPELFRGTSASSRGSGRGSEDSMIVGRSPAMRAVLATIAKVAPTDSTVLITGENGTGKELAARLIQRRSRRAAGPFVVVNCPALPGTLLEAELFGVEKGVATGVEARPGLLEAANGGTIFLDEVGDMDMPAQAKLLRFIQERTVERLGGRKPIQLDVRLLAATNHDLLKAMSEGRFRQDLYHRLNVVSFTLPPLRERPDDIPLLVEHFLSTDSGPRVTLSPEAMQVLMAHDYPAGVIEPWDLPPSVAKGEGAQPVHPARTPAPIDGIYEQVVRGGGSFWELVRKPYLRRELGREEVKQIIQIGYREGGRSYKGMARLFGIEDQYKKLVDFLRHHDLHADD